jgi:hypothetical protein
MTCRQSLDRQNLMQKICFALLIGLFAAQATNAEIPDPKVVNSTGYIEPGTILLPGDKVTSSNGRYTLFLQPDGNLVLYNALNAPIWSSGTYNQSVSFLALQGDGNLVLFGTGDRGPIWSTGTWNANGATLRLQDDGNLVIYRWNSQAAAWDTKTYGK